MILGCDISTTKTGIAIIRVGTGELVHTDVIKLPNKSTLEERAWIFREEMQNVKRQYNIKEVYVEQPFFSGGPNAHTTSILLRFNGMCCYVLFDVLNKVPIYINPATARKQFGISFPRKEKLSTKDKKRKIIEHVQQTYSGTRTPFIYNKTSFGNPAPGTDDIADAIVLAVSGQNLKK